MRTEMGWLCMLSDRTASSLSKSAKPNVSWLPFGGINLKRSMPATE